ncbi:MAG TPA: DNA-binding protein, partial [Desulfarculaceae bacterium]|nr:DNA-binding protein [Desulfarculaceae bacterium]
FLFRLNCIQEKVVKIIKNSDGKKAVNKEIGSIEVAELLDTSPDNVNYMARKGILPAHKERKFWRFEKRAIVSWIRSHKLVEL